MRLPLEEQNVKKPKTLEEMGFKKSPEYKESRHPLKNEIAKIAASLYPKEFKPISHEEMLAMQPKSTQALLKGTYADEFPNQENWKANPQAYDLGLYDEAVGLGKFDPEQIIIQELNRKNSKNTQYNSNSTGATGHAKEKAANAWLYTPGIEFKNMTPEQKEKIVNLTEIKSTTPTPESVEDKEPFWQSLVGITIIIWLIIMVSSLIIGYAWFWTTEKPKTNYYLEGGITKDTKL